MTGEELRAQFARRLREHVDSDLVRADDVFHLHRWDDRPQQPPLQLHATAEQLGRCCRVHEDTRDALWPSSPVEVAGLDLLFVHLDETLGRALDTAPERRHLVLEPHLAVLTDPAVLDEAPPPPLPMPDLPPGDHRWIAHAPLSGATSVASPQQQPRASPGPGDDTAWPQGYRGEARR